MNSPTLFFPGLQVEGLSVSVPSKQRRHAHEISYTVLQKSATCIFEIPDVTLWYSGAEEKYDRAV